MSYADVAAKGPKQSDAEQLHPKQRHTNHEVYRVPDAVPEIAHSDSGVHSLDSLSTSSQHVSSIPSYADQQLAAERAEEAEREGKRAADKAAQQARDFTAQAEQELSRLEKETGQKYSEWSKEAKEGYEKWKKTAKKEASKAKKELKEDGRWMEENKGNPVVVGNAVAMTAMAGLLGIGAYRLHRAGELTWKVAGAWAGVVGLFAVGDYYVSQYFFKKYPPKQ